MLGVEVKLVYLQARKFFGFKEFRSGAVRGYVAEPEKAVADCLAKPRYCGDVGEVAKALYFGAEELGLRKLLSYAERRGRSVYKRLCYLLDLLGFDLSEAKPAKGYAVLDPTRERRGRYDPKWGLLVNVDLRKVLEELSW